MSRTPLPNSFRGIIPPIVTPLRSRDELDAAGLERLIEHILAGGVHGLFVLGTTGEAPSLSYRLRRELIERTCRQVAGRVPVLVGITDTAIGEAVHLADFAANAGAQALVLAPPYYFPNSQPELLAYVQHLAPELPLPLFLYNMPTHTKTIFEVETVRRAMEIPNIVGLKDSSASMVSLQLSASASGLLPSRPEWSLLVGPEELLGESVLLGGHGGDPVAARTSNPSSTPTSTMPASPNQLDRIRELHARVHANLRFALPRRPAWLRFSQGHQMRSPRDRHLRRSISWPSRSTVSVKKSGPVCARC